MLRINLYSKEYRGLNMYYVSIFNPINKLTEEYSVCFAKNAKEVYKEYSELYNLNIIEISIKDKYKNELIGKGGKIYE